MRTAVPRLTISALAAAVALLIGTMVASAHGGKDTEDGVYKVSFGATPEPAVTDSTFRLEFRLNVNADSSLVSGVTDAQIAVAKDGAAIKSFAAAESPASRRGKGWYDTEVIIVTQPATYQVTITFTDAGGKRYSMEIPWEVKPRSELYVTGPTETESAIAELREEVEHADESADSAQEKIESLEAQIESLITLAAGPLRLRSSA